MSRISKAARPEIIVLLCITALLAVLIGKLVVNDHEYDPLLYSYGILVTSGLVLLLTVRYTFYRDPYEAAKQLLEKQPPQKVTPPRVSIMVAAFNEADFINQCVDSLIKQTYMPAEVIVVNDASTDATAACLEQYIDNPRVTVFNLDKNVGKKRALAHAMLHAQGEIFVFTDSDSILAPDAVEKLVTVFSAFPQIGGVSGHTRANNADTNLLTKIQDTWYEGQFSVRKAYESVFGAVTCVSGPLAAFRRAAVFNLIPAWINDRFLGQEFKFATDRTKTALVLANRSFTPKVRAKYADSPFITRENHPPQDWLVVYTKSANAWTNVPDTLPRLLKQQVRWKKSFLRNIWLTGGFYWKKPLPAALMYYLRGILVFAGPFIVFRHLIWLPIHGDWYSAMLYLSGIFFVGFVFATLHRLERPDEQVWIYRPLMNLISTFLLSWIIFYSTLTIRKMVWHRG